MRLFLILALASALTACSAGGGPSTIPAPNPTAAPTNVLQPMNGETVALATCVPVTNLNATGYDPNGPNTFDGQLVVGTACSYVASANGPVVNGNAGVKCIAQVPSITNLIDAFICLGNPYQ